MTSSKVIPALEQLAAVEAVIGKQEGILVDTGYFSADNVAQCEMAEVTPYIASGRDAHNQSLANRQAPASEIPVDADPPPSCPIATVVGDTSASTAAAR